MKKFFLIFLVLALLLGTLGCGAKEPDPDSLEQLLTTEYDLAQLEEDIKPGNTIRAGSAYFPFDLADILFYKDLDAKYPIEVFRDAGDAAYTVYRVTQGGYYYVFWSFAYPKEEMPSYLGKKDWADKDHLCVYFSTYIPGSKGLLAFSSLKVGTTTLADVLALDPQSEYCDLSYRCTCCYWSRDYALQIYYRSGSNFLGDPRSAGNVIVKDIRIVPREESVGLISNILEKDLP